jgi:putative peptidoglycan lipid II flippase
MEKQKTKPSNKRDTGLLRSSFVVSFFTGLSRVAGLVRDVVFARLIGADALADVFFVAFKIPNFFRRIFAEGAFSQAFVPVLGEYREGKSKSAEKNGTAKMKKRPKNASVKPKVPETLLIKLFTALFDLPSLYSPKTGTKA